MDTGNYDKLRNFTAAVNHQIEEKIAGFLDEAEKERENILKNAQTDSETAGKKHFEELLQKRGGQYVRAISKAELDVKKELLLHREELAEKLFADVARRLSEYRASPQYADYLVKSLETAVSESAGDGGGESGETTVFLSPPDMVYADRLKDAASGAAVEADESNRLGGLAVFNRARGTIIDKTFDTALEEHKHQSARRNAYSQSN
jgi:vacuolar-type H+-ATPase subunit E/Vma4